MRALVRDQAKSDLALKRGASETVIGDLEDPVSLRKATEGIDAVFHIGPGMAPNEAAMGLALVGAAKAAGARKFVLSGVIHPSLSQLTNHAAKLPVEEAMYESGMTFTVLQPAIFMQNIAGYWAAVIEQDRFSLPYSVYAKDAYVDYRDVAEAAALALTCDMLYNGTFELCATGMMDRMEIALMMSEVLGRNVGAAEVPFEKWAHKAHLPEGPLKDGLKRMFSFYNDHGFPGGNSLVFRAILGREPRSLRQYLQELAEQRRAS